MELKFFSYILLSNIKCYMFLKWVVSDDYFVLLLDYIFLTFRLLDVFSFSMDFVFFHPRALDLYFVELLVPINPLKNSYLPSLFDWFDQHVIMLSISLITSYMTILFLWQKLVLFWQFSINYKNVLFIFLFCLENHYWVICTLSYNRLHSNDPSNFSNITSKEGLVKFCINSTQFNIVEIDANWQRKTKSFINLYGQVAKIFSHLVK